MRVYMMHHRTSPMIRVGIVADNREHLRVLMERAKMRLEDWHLQHDVDAAEAAQHIPFFVGVIHTSGDTHGSRGNAPSMN